MRIDTEIESLHITEIAQGLERIKHFLSHGDSEPINIEVTAMEAAVAAYEKIQSGFLPVLYSSDTMKECCHYVAAAMDLVRYFRKIPDKNKIKQVRGHLGLIGKGGFGIYATYQKILQNDSYVHTKIEELTSTDSSKEIARDAARKSIELMLGLACLNKFDRVILEDPYYSNDKNPNPDLIVVSNKKRYGIACKSISSNSKTNFREHVEKAIEQVDKSTKKGKVDPKQGIVFFDISALLNHDKLFEPSFNYCWNKDSAIAAIQSEVDNVIKDIIGSSSAYRQKFLPLFKGSCTAPCIVTYAHSLMICENQYGVYPYYYKVLRYLEIGDSFKVSKFVKELNNACHCQ